MMLWWRWRRVAVLSCAIAIILCVFSNLNVPIKGSTKLQEQYPLLWKHVHAFNGSGGAWYTPPDWLSESGPKTIVDTAQLAFHAANSSIYRRIAYSSIPLIVHQKWRNTHIHTWSDAIRDYVEKWLAFAIDGEMAYFLWDDDGVNQLLNFFDPGLTKEYSALEMDAERADVFRILVSKWIGGIYSDIDTEPLQSPVNWITARDIATWVDYETGDIYNSTGPVNAVIGIEADCPPESDSYWRMGYAYPIQLTQWTFAFAPDHPILSRFMDNFSAQLSNIAGHFGGTLNSQSARNATRDLDPLVLTGPVAFTVAAKTWLSESVGLRWNALSGLKDGGRAKLVDDVLVLPITGFSPGRGAYGNMGSKPITDPDARLLHHGLGSWKSFDLRVEYGKFCRTVFGLCKNWSKVPS
ncbi:alpha-1,6-mannosyltransferase [Xylogone sp. PMI_703]|nr:alpha-1,6-mannosyltransferase [Xylogone sp. PMI_703]